MYIAHNVLCTIVMSLILPTREVQHVSRGLSAHHIQYIWCHTTAFEWGFCQFTIDFAQTAQSKLEIVQ